jgi:hypothetical protein
VSSKITPCTITYGTTQLQFLLHGTIGNGSEMKLLFIFPLKEPILKYEDLVKLDKKEFNLSSSTYTVKIDNTILQVSSGKLTFDRVQLLIIDDVKDRAILSGTFDLTFTKDGATSKISDGRFDLNVDK